MKELDFRIAELRTKPDSPDTLNALGDLYLRKGDRNRAVACYYESVDKLHAGQKDKKIAIFKKILKVAPSEEKAYEGIIQTFSKLGLYGEEKRYLMMLAQLCQNKGEYNKMNAIFRRVQEIDPGDTLAASYFQKGKLDMAGVEGVAERALPQSPARISAPDLLPETREIEKPQASPGVAETKTGRAEQEGRPFSSETRVVAEKAEDEQPGRILGRKSLVIAAGLALLVVVAVVMLLVTGRGRKEAPPVKETQTAPRLLAEMQHNGYRISVSEVAQPQQALPSIGEQVFKAVRLYRVTVGAPEKGCLPDAFVDKPLAQASWVDPSGKEILVPGVAGLDAAHHIIRKANSCDRETAPVFVTFWVPQEKTRSDRSIRLVGLSQEGPILIQWSTP